MGKRTKQNFSRRERDFYGTVGARLLMTFDEWFEKHVVALRWYLDYIGDDKELKAAQIRFGQLHDRT